MLRSSLQAVLSRAVKLRKTLLSASEIFGRTTSSRPFCMQATKATNQPEQHAKHFELTMEISAPHALVRLPRTTRPDAATYFGCVCAVREGMKRRRKEICAAVDGDSISIYEVLTHAVSSMKILT